jgi:hypothetical protein
VTLGGVLTTGNVGITAGTSIIDGGDALVDVVASGLRLVAGVGIGAPTNAIETTVTTLTARATSGGVYLLETDGLTVDDVSVTTQRVGTDASTGTSGSSDAVQADVITTGGNGSIDLRTLNGSITLGDGTVPDDDTAVSAHGSGTVFLKAQGDDTDVVVSADIRSGSGTITVHAARSIAIGAAASVGNQGAGTLELFAATGGLTMAGQSALATGGGAILVGAASGAILMQPDARMESVGGNVSLRADRGVELGVIDASIAGQPSNAGGTVSLRSDGGGSRIVSAQAATGINVRAAALKMQGYGLKLGETGRALRTDAPVLDLSAPGGVLARQTQADGEIHHVAMVNDALYLQAASVGAHVTAKPRASQGWLPQAELALKQLPVSLAALSSGGLDTAAQVSPLPGALSATGRADTAASSGLARVVGLGSASVSWSQAEDQTGTAAADVLSRAFILGSPFSQPVQAGLSWTDSSLADYWLDNLSL